MIYQKLLVGKEPYFISVNVVSAFEAHRHPEIELSYCLTGSYTVLVDNKKHHLKEGGLLFVAPVVSHEILEPNTPSSRSITMELGPSLLGEHFQRFMKLHANCVCLDLKTHNHTQLRQLIEETAVLHEKRPNFYDLEIKGNLLKIGAILLQLICGQENPSDATNEKQNIMKIQKALSLIQNRYNEPLTVETASVECDYSKSNFCKIFKSITGDTFHNALNRHRIDIACMHLQTSSDSIEEIALNVGFTDTKSFCRVFKKIMGQSAGAYRKAGGRKMG